MKFITKVTVDEKKCNGCGTCIQVCPASIYVMKNNKSHVKQDKVKDCLECKACEVSCPQKAIKVE